MIALAAAAVAALCAPAADTYAHLADRYGEGRALHALTPEGEVFLEHARRILADIDDLGQLLVKAKGAPKGLLRVNATLGFGRMHVAPVISRYARLYPDVDVQLQL